MEKGILRAVDNYALPREVYYQCLWLVRDVERLKKLSKSANKTSIGKASAKRVKAIKKALEALPEEYRQAVADNIISGVPFPDIAHDNTWRKWKKRFIYEVAVELELI